MKRTILMPLLLLVACNPKLYSPSVEVPQRYSSVEGFVVEGDSIDTRWWLLFDDERLHMLEERASANNRDIATAMSNVEEAYYALKAVRSSHYPELDFDIEVQFENNPTEGRVNSLLLERSISWQIPLSALWRAENRQQQAQLLASDWAAYGVWLTITTEVATTYYQLAGYRDLLKIAEHNYRLRCQSEALIDSMYRYGFASLVDVERTRTLTLEALSDCETLNADIARCQYALDVLIGAAPSPEKSIETISTLDVEALPQRIAIGQPVDLLLRRPDIMQSRREMEAAAARVGIARFNRFPTLPISASGGVYGNSLKEFFRLDKLVWSTAASLVAPVVGFGRLRRAEKQSVEQYNQAAYAYEKCVLQAFADVEGTLAQIEALRGEVAAARRMVEASSRAQMLNRELWLGGMASLNDYIDAERDAYSAQQQLSQAVVALYKEYITLIKAIGGGWSE